MNNILAAGLVGLSPRQPSVISGSFKVPMFLDALYDQGVIKDKLFSVAFNNYYVDEHK